MSNLRIALLSAGNRALGSTRQGFNNLKASLANLKSAGPPAPLADDAGDGDGADVQVKEHLSERSISSQLLRISALAVALKALHYFVDRAWLQTATSAGTFILGVPLWMWTMISSLTFVPIACALAMAVVTWCTVFLDRCIPGVSPPSSLPVKKHWALTPSTFHLGHAIAVVNGFLLTLLFYFGGSDTPSV